MYQKNTNKFAGCLSRDKPSIADGRGLSLNLTETGDEVAIPATVSIKSLITYHCFTQPSNHVEFA